MSWHVHDLRLSGKVLRATFSALSFPTQAGDPAIAYYGQGALMPPNSTSDAEGSVVLQNLVGLGEVLVSAAENVQDTLDDCLSACRALDSCNLVAYCQQQVGGSGQAGCKG